MTIYGCKTGIVKDDMGNSYLRQRIMSRYPDAIEMHRAPLQFEQYVQGSGYVKDTVLARKYDDNRSLRDAIAYERHASNFAGASPHDVRTIIMNEFNIIRAMPDTDITDLRAKITALVNQCESLGIREAMCIL